VWGYPDIARNINSSGEAVCLHPPLEPQGERGRRERERETEREREREHGLKVLSLTPTSFVTKSRPNKGTAHMISLI
jgi:hypothetical protein